MSGLFEGLFGGGQQTTRTQTTARKEYPQEYAPLAQSGLDMQGNFLLPLDLSLLQSLAAGSTPAGRTASMVTPIVGAQGGATFDPLTSFLQALELAQAQEQYATMAQMGREVVPGRYAPSFQPNTSQQTVSEVDASGNPLGDLAAIASLAGPLIGLFCWVADALYGKDSLSAQYARLWVSEGWQGWQADAFRWGYRRVGPRLAAVITRYPWLGAAVRPLFDRFARQGWLYWIERTVAVCR